MKDEESLDGGWHPLLSRTSVLAEAITKQMMGSTARVLLPRKQQPNDKVNDLPSSISLAGPMPLRLEALGKTDL